MINKKILVTGTAGFIGYHLCKALAEKGYEIYGIDNLNTYYDVKLKEARLRQLGIEVNSKLQVSDKFDNLKFSRIDLIDDSSLNSLFEEQSFDVVVNLAAQAGVRYSIENPKAYIDSNIVGFANVLEACRKHKIRHLIYASSSSVYGNSTEVPFREDQDISKPVSLYAATKISNELMAKTYTHLYGLKTTGLRFFTVYGPWGRPDMAPFLFTKALLNNEPIKVFNYGDLYRDFTYVDDIINGVVKVLEKNDHENESRIFNIGNNKPVKLMDFIYTLEQICGKKAKLEMLPMQPGDVYQTYADINLLKEFCGFFPKTEMQTGMTEFVNWYKEYIG